MKKNNKLTLEKNNISKSMDGDIANKCNSINCEYVIIENISPQVDSGKFRAKAIVGEKVIVSADIFKDGPGKIRASLLYKEQNEKDWRRVEFLDCTNDRWTSCFIPTKNTTYLYKVEAWFDPIATLFDVIEKKCLDNQQVKSDALEVTKLLQEIKVADKGAQSFANLLKSSEGFADEVLRIVQNEDLKKIVEEHPVKRFLTTSSVYELTVDKKIAEYGAWYELFPRSYGMNGRHGTFKDCMPELYRVKKLGFDVIYLPPIHPIGMAHRKGKNGVLTVGKNDPGSPWAIGSAAGGHKAIHPELGTMHDFIEFVKEANKLNIEIALDFAIQCSPDHPYVKEHPEWFYILPDGHIKYAENPPKKYQDIYPINFNPEKEADRVALWQELKSILLFWIDKGVKIFRVDNPHTKPLNFWKWVIEEIKNEHPEVIFLAEAFTRPKVMKYLAKAGFSQSYTYFTWRNTKAELREYLEELTQTDMKDYFRGNFFCNTPDILHEYLQSGGRNAFKIRLILAGTLSSTYGIYSGYELCENIPREEGSEEYLDSEKYELKTRDWEQKGNLCDFITKFNVIRNDNQALKDYKNLEFYESKNKNIIAYGKRSDDNSNIIVIVVNLDTKNAQEDIITLPIKKFGIDEWQAYQVKDLITEDKYFWKGPSNFIRLDPSNEVAHIFQIKK